MSSTRVELKNLPKDQASRAVDYLASKLKVDPDGHGSEVSFQGATDREIRSLLRKYLHSQSLDSFRIISGNGLVEVLTPKPEKEHVKIDRRATAPATVTMPYYFPQTTVVKPPRKKKQ